MVILQKTLSLKNLHAPHEPCSVALLGPLTQAISSMIETAASVSVWPLPVLGLEAAGLLRSSGSWPLARSLSPYELFPALILESCGHASGGFRV